MLKGKKILGLHNNTSRESEGLIKSANRGVINPAIQALIDGKKKTVFKEEKKLPIPTSARETILGKIPEWTYDDSAIMRIYKFDGFGESIEFVNEVAKVSQEHKHNPEIEIYHNEVDITFKSYDIGDITLKDVEMAGYCDVIYEELRSNVRK